MLCYFSVLQIIISLFSELHNGARLGDGDPVGAQDPDRVQAELRLPPVPVLHAVFPHGHAVLLHLLDRRLRFPRQVSGDKILIFVRHGSDLGTKV